uniref:GOLD domain-containing protein n=1 Tax=Caenorhabditis tropicalis TaxID=1561998 RepID=A0A1I7SYT3_9PELO
MLRCFLILTVLLASKCFCIFSDAYVDMRFLLETEKECVFFEVHQPHSQMDIAVSALNSEYPLSVELINPSGISVFKTPNTGKHYFKYPEIDGDFHEIGDFQLCISSRQIRQPVQVSLIIVIHEKNSNNIDVASNLKRIRSNTEVDETRMTLQNFEKITLNIDMKLKIMKTEQAKRAFVEKIDRQHIETAFEMINFWHIMRVFLVVFIAGFQVHAIRTLLK